LPSLADLLEAVRLAAGRQEIIPGLRPLKQQDARQATIAFSIFLFHFPRYRVAEPGPCP
jgi:hypothetical protein